MSVCRCLFFFFPSSFSPHAAKLIDAFAIDRSIHRLCILVFTAVNV